MLWRWLHLAIARAVRRLRSGRLLLYTGRSEKGILAGERGSLHRGHSTRRRLLQCGDKSAPGSGALRRIFRKALQQHLLNSRRDVRVDLPWRRWRRGHVLNGCRIRCIGMKRELPRKELGGNDRQAIVIAGGFGLGPGPLLSHIPRAAHAGACLRKMLLVGARARDANIKRQDPFALASWHTHRPDTTVHHLLS